MSSDTMCRGLFDCLGLAEVRQDRVNEFKGLVNLLADLGTSENDLARDEDQEDNLWLHHAVNETWEKFGFVRAEHVMARCQTLETNRKLDVARANNVLDLEVGEFGVETELLNDTSILARRKLRIVFRLCTSDDHFATCKDQSSGLGFANTHDDGGETLEETRVSKASDKQAKLECLMYLWVVLCVTGVQSNGLEIESAVKVHCRNNVPLKPMSKQLHACTRARHLLQSRYDTTDTLACTRRSSRSSGSHPGALRRACSLLCRSIAMSVRAVCLLMLSIFFR